MRFTFTITDAEETALERLRVERGARSVAEALRAVIREVAGDEAAPDRVVRGRPSRGGVGSAVALKDGRLRSVVATGAVKPASELGAVPVDGERRSRMVMDGRSGAPMKIWEVYRQGSWVRE